MTAQKMSVKYAMQVGAQDTDRKSKKQISDVKNTIIMTLITIQ